MKVIKIANQSPNKSFILKAASVLKQGGLLVYPTDTAYGLGANALDEKAVRKVYKLKNRDFSKPTHVIVRDWEMIEQFCLTNKKAKKLYETSLPGPLTLILPKKDIVPDVLTANLETLGVRIPNNHITTQLSHCVAFPYTTPSANRQGEPAPFSIEEVKKVLDFSKVDLILNGGKLPLTPPSTIVDLSVAPAKILREGPISKKGIFETIN